MAMKLALVLAGAAAATSTTTPAPVTDCTYAGVSNFGSGLSPQCCASAKIMVAYALLSSTLLPSSTKQLVTSCVPTDAGIGSCVGTGSWPFLPTDVTYLTAAGISCAGGQACGTQVLQGLTAANHSNAMNPTLKAGFDATSDGVLDACVILAAMSGATTTGAPTTATSTTTEATTTSTTTTQASGGNSSAPAGAVISGAVTAFAMALAALA